MTSIDIEIEYMAHLYRTVLDKGRDPDLDEFETNEIDAEIERWAKEDADVLEAYDLRNNPDAWEEVTVHEQ